MCIENYPDKNVPTLIIYNNGEPVQQLAGLRLANGDLKLKEKGNIYIFTLYCLLIFFTI